MVKPFTVVIVAPVVVAVCPPDEVIVYPVIAVPPLLAGALHETVASVLPATAFTPVGAPGIVDGVTALEAADEFEVPMAFVATMVKVCGVPFVKPVTVAVVAPAVVAI